jgi:hypothetical protein
MYLKGAVLHKELGTPGLVICEVSSYLLSGLQRPCRWPRVWCELHIMLMAFATGAGARGKDDLEFVSHIKHSCMSTLL